MRIVSLAFLVLACLASVLFGQAGPVSDAAAQRLAALKSAEKQLRGKIKSQPNDAFLKSDLATVLYRQAKVLEARDLWDEAAAEDANLSNADISIVRELLRRGDISSARLALISAEEKDKQNPHLYLARGEMELAQKRIGSAEAEFKRAIELNPKLLHGYLWLGKLSESKQQLNEAAAYFTKATEVAPKRPNGWLLLAATLFRQNKISDSYKTLQSLEKTPSNQASAEVRLADFYLKSKDFLGARKWYLKRLARKPDEINTRLSLTDVLLQLKQFDSAAKHLEEVTQAEENTKALITLASIETRNKNYKKADGLYRRAIKADPKNVIAYNNLAMLLLEADPKSNDLLSTAKSALQYAPNNLLVKATYGCVLAEIGQSQEAKAILEEVVRLSPHDPWVRYYYGKILFAENRFEQARDNLEGCLILNSEISKKDKINKMLKIIGEKSSKF
jgi:tetratricopeptide (TPR) repeat protein